MGRSSTRIYNKFEYWSVADCACELCQFHSVKEKSCTLGTCCIEDIRQEAIRREETNVTTTAAYTGGIIMSGIESDVSGSVVISGGGGVA